MTISRNEILSVCVFFIATVVLFPNALCGVIFVPLLFKQLSIKNGFHICLCDSLILAFCLYVVISPIWSINANNAIIYSNRILMVTLIYLFTRLKIRSECQLKLIVIGANVAILLICIVTIMQYIIHHITFSEAGFNNMAELKPFYRPFFQPVNKWGAFLLCLLPYAIIPYLCVTSRMRVVYVVNILLVFVAIFICFSKGSYIALLIFLIGLAAYGIAHRAYLRRILAVLIGAVLCLVIVNHFTANAVFNACNIFESCSQLRSIESRGEIWKQAIKIFKSNPILGIGYNNYPIIAERLHALKGGLYSTSTTNSYLQLLAEGGAIGFLIFGGIVISFVNRIFNRETYSKIVPIIMFLFVITIAVKEFTFSSVFSSDYVLGIFIVSVAVTINYMELAEYEQSNI